MCESGDELSGSSPSSHYTAIKQWQGVKERSARIAVTSHKNSTFSTIFCMNYLPENVSAYILLNAFRKLTLRSAGASLSLYKKTQFQAQQCLQCSASRHLVPACTNHSRNCSTVGLPAPSSGLSQKKISLNLGYAIQRTSVLYLA